ncbi:hypothetical protein HYDPIDRAFT_33996 [Hydnomerulius pinastri MD-312]|uniref:Uncharacterized protein n=1 Tax=Hydnomerulius pinastri MD-312 TaxID=994086 RepID=A0A0C9V064_9AGAM|nr:hypothetical protein HYDPIDRAFT_33996 [Hydnomerulius pinastri MD-312]
MLLLRFLEGLWAMLLKSLLILILNMTSTVSPKGDLGSETPAITETLSEGQNDGKNTNTSVQTDPGLETHHEDSQQAAQGTKGPKKRQLEDLHAPYTPRYIGGNTTNHNAMSRASSVPALRPLKRQRLLGPLDVTTELPKSSVASLEEMVRDVRADLKVAMDKQTEILSAILEALKHESSKF